MMNLKFKKVYTVSKKADKPRLFLQHVVCEAAQLQPGEELYISMSEEKEEILMQNYPFEDTYAETIHVASRTSKVSGQKRPLVDTAGEKYSSIIDIKQKVEICVFRKGNKSQILIKPLQYRLFDTNMIPVPKDERIRLLSLCAGAGLGTAALTDTQYFSAIQEIELEDDSVSVLQKNFPNSFIFNGDLRDCMDVAEVDVALVTLPCSEHSSLGGQSQNVMVDLNLAASKIIRASRASILFFENVPSFYKSDTWFNLKQLLMEDYPYWAQKEIEAWDFGSIATRKRVYVVAFQDEDRFQEFEFPRAPKVRRKKLKDYLDPAHIEHEWKSLEKWMESFNSRSAWKDRSIELTFVSKDVDRINCVPSRYTSHSASSSYVLSEDKEQWRFLSISEIKRILGVPEWFEFCEHTPKIRTYEMLGQSVCGNVMKAIANRIAYTFMKVRNVSTETIKKVKSSYSINGSGQLELAI
jgi:DNA (cytosine-5)-methyltransferase 1